MPSSAPPDLLILPSSASSSSSSSTQTQTCTPNLLPCTIRYNGPIDMHARHWSPRPVPSTSCSSSSSSSSTNSSSHTPAPARATSPPTKAQCAYFRGRRLRGRAVAVPEGYRGMVMRKSGGTIPVLPPHQQGQQQQRLDIRTAHDGRDAGGDYEEEDDEDDDDDDIPATQLHCLSTFSEMVVWGHESEPKGDEDEYVRGVEEWVGFAEAVGPSSLPLLFASRDSRLMVLQIHAHGGVDEGAAAAATAAT